MENTFYTKTLCSNAYMNILDGNLDIAKILVSSKPIKEIVKQYERASIEGHTPVNTDALVVCDAYYYTSAVCSFHDGQPLQAQHALAKVQYPEAIVGYERRSRPIREACDVVHYNNAQQIFDEEDYILVLDALEEINQFSGAPLPGIMGFSLLACDQHDVEIMCEALRLLDKEKDAESSYKMTRKLVDQWDSDWQGSIARIKESYFQKLEKRFGTELADTELEKAAATRAEIAEVNPRDFMPNLTRFLKDKPWGNAKSGKQVVSEVCKVFLNDYAGNGKRADRDLGIFMASSLYVKPAPNDNDALGTQGLASRSNFTQKTNAAGFAT